MDQYILIKNGTVITLGNNLQVLPETDVLVNNKRIEKIGKKLVVDQSTTKVVDASGKVVMPGFINAHMHFYSTLVRGLGKAEPAGNFQEVLENLWWRLDKKLVLDDCYYSALIMLIQAIKCGTTTLIDHHASPGAITGSLMSIAKAVEESGLRVSLCYELSNRDGENIRDEGLRENGEFIQYVNNNPSDYLRAMFGLHASFTLTEDSLARASEIGNIYNSGFHVHVAEAESDQLKTKEICGLPVVERLAKHNLLGEKSIAAHCVHLSDAEKDILADTKTNVVHNPQSNLNNAVGMLDVVSLASKGITVGLGTDAMTVNMLEELRVALWSQHQRHQNPSIGFMEIANTLLRNNAKIANNFWQNNLGVLADDAPADIIIMDYHSPTPLNEETFLGHFLFGFINGTVDTTICNGRILMENKKICLDIDEAEIHAKAREQAVKLWKRF